MENVRYTHTRTQNDALNFKHIHSHRRQSLASRSNGNNENTRLNRLVQFVFKILFCCFKCVRANLLDHKIIIELLNNRSRFHMAHCNNGEFVFYMYFRIWYLICSNPWKNMNPKSIQPLMREPIKSMKYRAIDLIIHYLHVSNFTIGFSKICAFFKG